ncbi:uncharacterized protein PHALS_14859 [Plasmopara halstedii]|uniref:Uncharacterized protein n=1 Tax=Plasmopara halstedii TaxID=4781 RepID=A0A0P1AUQ0_PLAHL|nr:uncharacterized protein PHALS_14859 [Plasmopara halstedii]CEG46036.1 hypothetical protein PHALS_14859 [Plasmopara halstedii]|eukprot:XP_024582405.1 hypothetical protein PHALS_14859 [Plasmopara halstedii]
MCYLLCVVCHRKAKASSLHNVWQALHRTTFAIELRSHVKNHRLLPKSDFGSGKTKVKIRKYLE